MRKNARFTAVLLLLFFSFFHSLAQTGTVSGTVLSDADGTPLEGVTVTNKTTNKRTMTNQAGYYSIAAQKGQVLSFIYVGYTIKEVTVQDIKSVSVKLVNDGKGLNDVIVTAYGVKQSKRALAYQAQEIAGSDISETRRENFFNSLAGKVAGLMVTPSNGAPGSSTQIMLRGASSVDGNNSPLIVVDGVPYDNQTLNQENIVGGGANRNTDYGNRAMDLNPEDIESLVVLKGPEASALYGSDGASGALIITTRKGTKGKATISYDNSFKWDKVYRFPETQKVYARGTNGVTNPLSTVAIASISSIPLYKYFGAKYAPGTKLYDNMNAFFQSGFTQNHNLGVEGGSDNASYRLSMNYLNQDGIVPNTNYTKYSARMTGSVKMSTKMNLTTSFTYTNSKNLKAPKGTGSYFLNLLTFPADMDVTDYLNPDDTRKLLRTSGTTEFDNPFWDVTKNSLTDKIDRVTGNATLSYDLFPWWNIGLTSGIDYYAQIGDWFTHPQSRAGISTGGYYNIYEQSTRNLNNQVKFLFKKKFTDFNNTLLVGFTNESYRTDVQSQDGNQLYEQEFKSINNTLLSSRSSMASVSQSRKARFFGNYTLGYKSLLYLSLAGSREGNSNFMSRKVYKDPWYNFGSASLSFVFTDLPAFKNIPWLNFGKARLSYGTTGKGPVTPYIIDEKFTNSTFTGGGYSLHTTGSNTSLKPEFSKTLEYGGELKLFNNKLSLDITRYETRSTDQIINARVSYGTGNVLKYINGGEVTNKGVEILATVEPIKTKDIYWRSTFTFARNRGVITKMPAGLPTFYQSDSWVAGNLRSQMFEGAANGNLAGFIPARSTTGELLINPSTGLPTYSADFYTVGNRQPDWTGGWMNRLEYKEFSLSFTFDVRKGGDVFNGNEFLLYHIGLSARTTDRDKIVVYKGVLQDGMQNTATPTRNTITINPLTVENYYASVSANPESGFVESVNWIRLRDLTLAYNFPSRWLKRQNVISSAGVFITGVDLWMLTNYSGADPSVNVNNASGRGYGGAGIDYGSLASPRGVNFGCRVKF
jgi:TonB-linked SusC/RagA family outer membrane protein